MKFNDVLKMAFSDLGRRKGRTFLTSLAVAIGTMLIVTMVGLGTTAEGFIINKLNSESSAKKIQVLSQKYLDNNETQKENSEIKSEEDYEELQEKNFKKIDEDTIKNIKNINGVDIVKGNVTASISSIKVDNKESSKKAVNVIGYNDINSIYTKDEIDAVKKKKNDKNISVIVEGRALKDSDKNGILINQKLLKEMGINDYKSVVGKEITIIQSQVQGSNVAIKPMEVKAQVVGIVNEGFEDEYSNTIIAPLEMVCKMKAYNTLNKEYFKDKGYDSLIIYAKDAGNVKEIDEAVKKMGYMYMSNEEIAKQIKNAFTVVEQILSVLGIIVLFVAALGTVNTMTMAIHERTKSIGIMRSVGANKSSIHNIFLTQAAIIGFIGGIMGLVFSFANGKIIEFGLKLFLEKQGVKEAISFSMPMWLILGTLVFAIGISMISGIYPSRKASGLDVIEALNC